MAFYNRELETLDRRALLEHQKNRLAILIREIEANRFYQEKLLAAGTGVTQSLELSSIPFTTKNELVSEQREQPQGLEPGRIGRSQPADLHDLVYPARSDSAPSRRVYRQPCRLAEGLEKCP